MLDYNAVQDTNVTQRPPGKASATSASTRGELGNLEGQIQTAPFIETIDHNAYGLVVLSE